MYSFSMITDEIKSGFSVACSDYQSLHVKIIEEHRNRISECVVINENPGLYKGPAFLSSETRRGVCVCSGEDAVGLFKGAERLSYSLSGEFN